MLVRTHASLKEALKIETGERRVMWHKYVNIAALKKNTTTRHDLSANLVECAMDVFRRIRTMSLT